MNQDSLGSPEPRVVRQASGSDHRPPGARRFDYRLVLVLLLCSGSFCQDLVSAQSTNFNQRDDEYVLLGLKRAKESFELSRTNYERQKELFDQGLLSEGQLDNARQIYSEAEVNYQQSLLAALFEDQYIAVRQAVKQRDENGGKSVLLEIENTSGGGAELEHLAGLDDDLFRALSPERIHDVYVSLLNDEGAIISQPFEKKLESLVYGEPAFLEFDLLQDLDAVTVGLTFGNGSQRQVKVFLQRDESGDRVAVQPLQFSQEAALGSEATFEMGLELFSGSDDSYRLEVLGLPAEVHRFFSDPASGARLRQIRFAEATESRTAQLTITLPDRGSERLPLGEAIDFFVVAVPAARVQEIDALTAGPIDEERLVASGFGWARLEVVARGIGDLQVRAPQLFHRIDSGEEVAASLDLVNDGTAELRNIEIDANVPLGWIRRIDPPLIARLGVGEEARVTITLVPDTEVSPGRYEARVRTEALSDSQPIEGEDKLLTVEVAAPVNLFGSGALVLLILGLVGGLVAFGIRLNRQ